MPEKDPPIIVDNSTLIALSKLNLLAVLKVLYQSVFVPEAVLSEFGDGLPEWIQIISVKDRLAVTLLSEKLGDGESEVIAAGIERKDCVVVLDDLKARQRAKRLGLRMTGLLGILLKAKDREKISEIRPLLEKLDTENFRISEELKDEILKMADED